MKKLNFKTVFTLALIAIASISLSSCEKNKKDEPTPDIKNVGVHKIVFDITSNNPNVVYNIVLAGIIGKNEAFAKLYDEKEEFLGQNVNIQKKMGSLKKQVVIQTGNKATALGGSFFFNLPYDKETDENATLTFSVKAYINEKLVSEMKPKTITFGVASEQFSIWTTIEE
jgi:hypothetical protein